MANERRLIDAGALIAELRKSAEYHELRRSGYYSAIVHIKEQPTVDAVEVVRCESCVYGVEDDSDKGVWQCTKDAEYDEDSGMYFGFNSWHDVDFYCSCGERRCE